MDIIAAGGVAALKTAIYAAPDDWTTALRLFAIYVAIETASNGLVMLDAKALAAKYRLPYSKARAYLGLMLKSKMLVNDAVYGAKAEYRWLTFEHPSTAYVNFYAVRNVLLSPLFFEQTAAHRLVWLMLAVRSDSDTNTTLVGEDTVADLAQVNTKTVRRARASLESAGAITTEHRYTLANRETSPKTTLTVYAEPAKVVALKPVRKPKATKRTMPDYSSGLDEMEAEVRRTGSAVLGKVRW